MNKIEKIVKDFQIDEKRKDYSDNKEIIFYNKCEMSKLAMNRFVGQYVFNLDEYFYYIGLIKKINDDKKLEKVYERLDDLYAKIIAVQKNKKIMEYRNLRDEIKVLEEECNNFFKLINTDLREKLIYNEIPNIYVFQGFLDKENNLKYSRNILNPKMVCGYEEDFGTVIYPEYDMESNRDLRHFYNRVSFKYLNELTKDYSYDVEKKDLGKVRILTK